MTNPRVAIDIVANDKSGKGVGSAEKRIGSIPQHAGAATRRMLRDGDQAVRRSSSGLLRTLGAVEQASARAFGSRSITSGLASRVSALGEAASTARAGMSEAAAAGGLFEGAAAGVGVAVGATIGIVAAAAYGAFKLADGWAKGAASIGRTAEIIGVGTKALQEFSAAAERAGVDKDKATGSLGSLSQNLNDARYGRNSAVLATLGRLGVQMKVGANGDVDVEAMLPAIADAIARQGASGRRTVAKNLGIGLDALPAFSGGGKLLSGDMADAGVHAAVLDDGQIATGRRIARKGATAGQLAERAMSAAGAAAAGVTEAGYDAALSGGRALSDGTASLGGVIRNTFAPAASTIGRAAVKIEGAGEKLLLGVRSFFEGKGWTREQASGIAAGLHRESALRADARGDGGHAYGIGQWHADRQANFARVMGRSIVGSSREQQLAFVDWELRNTEGRAGKRLRGAHGGYEAGAIVSQYYERPADRAGEAHARGTAAAQLASLPEVPVRVTVEVPHAPAGTRAKVVAGRGNRPAVSHALVHG